MDRQAFTRLWISAALSGVLLFASIGHAQEPKPDIPSTYRQLIADAVNEYDAQHYERARSLFERAHSVWPNARTYRGLGKVSYVLERYRDAVRYLEQAQRSNEQPLDSAMRKDADSLRREAQSHLVRVSVRLEPRSAKLVVDGRIETQAPEEPLALDPGQHTVQVSAPGFVPQARAFSLQPRAHATWSIQLQTGTSPQPSELSPPLVAAANSTESSPLFASTSTARDSNPEPPRWLLPTGLSLAFVGVATLGVAAGFYTGYADNGDKFRSATQNLDAYQDRFLRSRGRALLFTGIGSGALSLAAGALGEYIPTKERRWADPTLLAAGTGLLVTGIALYASNGCTLTTRQSLQTCSPRIERADVGSMLAMLSAPLLTAPIVHAVEWLIHK